MAAWVCPATSPQTPYLAVVATTHADTACHIHVQLSQIFWRVDRPSGKELCPQWEAL
jgi:hypothetical protein